MFNLQRAKGKKKEKCERIRGLYTLAEMACAPVRTTNFCMLCDAKHHFVLNMYFCQVSYIPTFYARTTMRGSPLPFRRMEGRACLDLYLLCLLFPLTAPFESQTLA